MTSTPRTGGWSGSHAGPLAELAVDAVRSSLGTDRASVLLFDQDGVMRFRAWTDLGSDVEVVEGDGGTAVVLRQDLRARATSS